MQIGGAFIGFRDTDPSIYILVVPTGVQVTIKGVKYTLWDLKSTSQTSQYQEIESPLHVYGYLNLGWWKLLLLLALCLCLVQWLVWK